MKPFLFIEQESTNMASAKDYSREGSTATSVPGMCLYLCVYKMLYIILYHIIILVLHHIISYIVLYCAMFHYIY